MFLEIGGGDCEVTLLVSRHVAKAIVIDVTDELVPPDAAVPNFEFIKTAGVTVPLPSESVSFIYSNQVMEHLHPDDARAQLRELFRVLKPGGKYLCRTPSRVTGPHDVSTILRLCRRRHSHARVHLFRTHRALATRRASPASAF